jgi:adenylate cyclase, class 2
MRNIELKARLRDRNEALGACKTLNAAYQGDIHQVDTYFHVPQGRLKLREADPGRDELVFYRRPDVAGPKGCDYILEPVNRTIKPFLAEALGVLAVVDKVRTLYLWENVRIHLDDVRNLGAFIEFEAVLSDEYDDQDGCNKLQQLIHQFDLRNEDQMEVSYLDLIMEYNRSADKHRP